MDLRILAVGKLKKGPERELFDKYMDRSVKTGRSLHISIFNTIELMESRAADVSERKKQEGLALTEKLNTASYTIVLDERGKTLTSIEFSSKLLSLRDEGHTEISFVIGGADGLAPEMRNNAQMVLSLGKMTLPHGLVRVFLAEQLYRAMAIATGHPYHRE